MQRIGRSLHGELAFEFSQLVPDRLCELARLGRPIILGGQYLEREIVQVPRVPQQLDEIGPEVPARARACACSTP